MRLFSLKIVLLSFFFIGLGYNLFASQSSDYPAIYKTKTVLKIRQKASISSAQIGRLSGGEEVVVDSLYNANWACINYKGNVAYISNKYIRFQRSLVTSDDPDGFFRKPFFFSSYVKVRGFWACMLNCVYCICICLFFYLYIGFLINNPFNFLCIVSIIGLFYFGYIEWSIVLLGSCFVVFIIKKIKHSSPSNSRINFYNIIGSMMQALNLLQFFLQKPWRPLKHKVKTFEWWRTTGSWWEYCMIQRSGLYKKRKSIRPLYIENAITRKKERIYTGMAHWLFKI